MTRRCLYAGICLALCAWWGYAWASLIPIAREGTAHNKAIEAALKQPMVVGACFFKTIGYVEKAELSYLAAITPGARVTADDLKKAAARFQAKRAFDSIELDIEVLPSGKVRICWHLERDWIVNRVKLHGGIIGKMAYRALYALEPGDPFNQRTHDESLVAITEAFKREGYPHARVTSRLVRDYRHKTMTIHLYLNRGRKARKSEQPLDEHVTKKSSDVVYVFTGNTFLSRDDLMAIINAFGDTKERVPPAIIAGEIEREYQARGFWDVAVASREQDGKIIFEIAQGEGVRIAGIHASVAHKNPVAVIKEYFSEVLQHEFIDEKLLQDAIDRLIADYIHDGYFQARLANKRYRKQSDNARFIELEIDEGERHNLVAIKIPSYEDLEKQIPYASNLAQKPVACTTQTVQEQQQWLISYFKALGYERPDVKPEMERDGNQVTLVWRVNPGKIVVFGKTIVLGNGTLPIHYIMRELAYKQGERFDSQLLKESFKNLKDLELFDYISFSPCALDDAQVVERDMVLRVCSDTRCDLRARAGFGLQQFTRQFTFSGITYNIGCTAVIKNPFSIADRLCIDAESAFGYRNFSVSYRMPWLASIPVRTMVQGYTMRFDYPGITNCEQSLYQIDQGGCLLGFAKKYQAFDGALTAGVERMRLSINTICCPGVVEREQLVRALCINPLLLDCPTTYAQAEGTLFIDYLDNRLQPTRGLLTMLSAKAMVPFNPSCGREWFVRCIIDESFFVPFLPCVFAGRIRLGHLAHASLANCMPSERFYCGGANSVRSYGTDMAPPLGVFHDNCGHEHLVARGGTTMLTLNAELRFPIYNKFQGAFFQDVGFLWGGCSDADYGKPLLGTGIGLRYATPIGPLRFDIAYNWQSKNAPTGCYAWFLTFGHAF